MTDLSKHVNLEAYLGDYLFKDFEQRFQIVYAKTNDLKREAYAIRKAHLLASSADENSPTTTSKMGIDSFDLHSHHLLLQDIDSKRYVGTIRLIVPQATMSPFSIPLATIEQDPFLAKKLKGLQYGSFGEIASLAIVPQDKSKSESLSSAKSMGVKEGFDFPQITMGLYLGAIALAKQLFLSDVFTAIKPMLFKKLRGFGVLFEHASATFQDDDTKAVYQLALNRGNQTSKILDAMNQCITQQLSTQLDLYPEISYSLENS